MISVRALAGTALVLALAALMGGGLDGPGKSGVQELRAELASGAPLLDAVNLGEWIRDRRPVRILDVQDSAANVRFSIPTAVHVRRPALVAIEPGDVPIVIYDDGTGEAARAWLLLRRLGHPRVHVLDRGVLGWIDGVLEPVLPAGTPEERAIYDRTAAVSRYFGGMPRIGSAPEPSRDPGAAVRLLSRRGCY